jgi:hypothetical protein
MRRTDKTELELFLLIVLVGVPFGWVVYGPCLRCWEPSGRGDRACVCDAFVCFGE